MSRIKIKTELYVKKDIFLGLNVGKIKDAENASHMCRTNNTQKAFMQGFRFARNNLQTQKSDFLYPAPTKRIV